MTIIRDSFNQIIRKETTVAEKEQLQKLADQLLEHHGIDVISLHVGEASVIADDFLIASADSRPQLQAMTDAVEEQMSRDGFPLKSREGRTDSGWILLDYGFVVVHLFSREMREFYHLEHTWRDVPRTSY